MSEAPAVAALARAVHDATRRAAKELGFEHLRRRLGEDDRFVRLWPRVRDLTLLDPFRAWSLVNLLRASEGIEGDVIECGVARGGTALLLALVLEETGSPRRLVLCDTFRGLPPPDRRFDRKYGEGYFAVPIDVVLRDLARAGVERRCDLVPGRFAESLPGLVAAGRSFSFVHLDADLYASTKDALGILHPRVSPGAPIVLDDYHDDSGGVELAASEHLAETGEALQLGPTGQAFFFRRREGDEETSAGSGPVPGPAVAGARSRPATTELGLARLARVPGYEEFLRACEESARNDAAALASLAARLRQE